MSPSRAPLILALGGAALLACGTVPSSPGDGAGGLGDGAAPADFSVPVDGVRASPDLELDGATPERCPPLTRFPLHLDPDPAKDDLLVIVPLGNLNPTSHVFPTSHIYLYPRSQTPGDPNSPPAIVPVVFPGDATVTQIITVEHRYPPMPNPPLDRVDHTDYQIAFATCSQVLLYFDHLGAIAPRLAAAIVGMGGCMTYMTGGQTVKRCSWDVNVPVAAGEPVGMTSAFNYAMDFGAYDARVTPLAYANPARDLTSPSRIDFLHLTCPLDEYVPAVEASLASRVGLVGMPRTATPICGEIAQDKAGTAQGRWYAFATPKDPMLNFPEDPHLALVHDNADPRRAAFSVGTSIPALAGEVLEFLPARDPLRPRVNRDFAEVTTDGNVYCFEPPLTTWGYPLPAGEPQPVLLVQLVDAGTLLVEGLRNAKGCDGVAPGGAFQLGAPVKFYR